MTPAVFVLRTSHPLQCGAAECGAGRISLLEQEIRRVLSAHDIREGLIKPGFRSPRGVGRALSQTEIHSLGEKCFIRFKNGPGTRGLAAFRPVSRRFGGKRAQWSRVQPVA